METEPILETTIRKARGLLWANWPSVHNLTDAETVARLSDIISSSAVMWALRRSDTFFAFVLRAIRRVLADHSQTDRQVITSLWSIFDDPDLNGALDIPQKSPGSAGRAGATANLKLTFHLDHSAGADQGLRLIPASRQVSLDGPGYG
jgi:hypothetical protein